MYHKKSKVVKIFFTYFFIFILLSGCKKDEKHESYLNVETVDALKLEEILENENGKTVLLNVWATWCSPCIEEFPDLIKLADHYASDDVQIIAISVDYPDEIDSKIIPFLKKTNVNFPVYVQNFKKQEDLINQLNKDWSGAIPASFIYDKNGNQVDFILGKHNFAEFKSSIDKIRELN